MAKKQVYSIKKKKCLLEKKIKNIKINLKNSRVFYKNICKIYNKGI